MVNTLAFNSCFDKGLLWAKYIVTLVIAYDTEDDSCCSEEKFNFCQREQAAV